MSKHDIENIQGLLTKHYAEERKKLGDSFLAALYNLCLLDGDFSQETKHRLSYIVWLFFELPSTNLGERQDTDGNRPPGFGFSDGFFIRGDMIGYEQGEENWWDSKDFYVFQRNYRHLCGLIESCIEGEYYRSFQREDIKWLDKKISRLLHFSVQLQFKEPIFLVGGEGGTVKPAEIPPDVSPPLIPINSTVGTGPPPDGCVNVYLDLPGTGGAWLFKQFEDGTIPFDQFNPVIVHTIERDMPPSDRILCQAYLELLEAINGRLRFRRCEAEPTQKHSACQNIFRINKQRGPKRIWCSSTCRRRVNEHRNKARNRTQNRQNYR